jgi:hypothetical protein
VGFTEDFVVVACTEVLVAEVVFVGLLVVVFFDEVLVADEDDDPGLGGPPGENVEPISPHLMFENVTYVPGVVDSIVAGFPAVLLHGPELPLSSQFMNWLLSFQMLSTRTMPLPSALPMVVKPPRLAATESDDEHDAAVIESRPEDVDTAFGINLPFWM